MTRAYNQSQWETEGESHSENSCGVNVSLLTGGADRPYVHGLATSLMGRVDCLEIIGSDDVDFPEFTNDPRVKFLNLRGSHRSDVSALTKMRRVFAYYIKLIRYSAVSTTGIFHILWNNKFETFDRTTLMVYYRMLGKKIVLTAHNVNAGKRDANDSWLNRLTLKIQYHLADHIFVHTEKMKSELIEEFGVNASQVEVIPFGINNSIPNSKLTNADARKQLGIPETDKVILFFGNITPYKGLEYLVAAFQKMRKSDGSYRLVVAGRPGKFAGYWSKIRESLAKDLEDGRVLLNDSFIPDLDVELYFKAADILVIPYRHIFQSGVLFLGQSFGIPTIATDVGSLREDIMEGETGFIVRPDDSEDLVRALEGYFVSDLYKKLASRRPGIRERALKDHSWETVAQITTNIYANLLRIPVAASPVGRQSALAGKDARDLL